MTFSYIAQTTFKRAHKSIYETLKIVFKFTAKQVCQKPLFTETPALGSRSWADLLQAALSDGATCVLAGMLEMQHSLWCVFQTSPNFSKWEKDAQRTVTKQLSCMHMQAAHLCTTGFWPAASGSGVVLAIKLLVHLAPCCAPPEALLC